MKKTFLYITVIITNSCNAQINSSEQVEMYLNTPIENLANALNREDTVVIKNIIEENKEFLDFPNSFGDEFKELLPIISWTIKNNKYVSFKTLLELGANVDIKSNSGFTPLIIACQSDYNSKEPNSLTFVMDLVDNGADINYVRNGYYKTTNDGEKFYRSTSPLNAAIQRRNIDLVKYLFHKGVNLDTILSEPSMDNKPVWKFNALMSAISRKDMQMAKFLLIDGKADYNWVLGYDYSDRTLNISYFLRRCYFLKDSEKLNQKKQILDYLVTKGVKYNESEIPEEAINFAKQNYPDTWETYLEEY